MAVPYRTAWEPHGVVWTFWGPVTGEELLASNLEIYGDPRFDLIEFQLVDLTRVVQFDVAPDDMITIAATDRAAALTNPRVIVAVASSNEIIRELSRLYERQNSGSPWSQRIFDSVEEARTWLSGPRSHDAS